VESFLAVLLIWGNVGIDIPDLGHDVSLGPMFQVHPRDLEELFFANGIRSFADGAIWFGHWILGRCLPGLLGSCHGASAPRDGNIVNGLSNFV
jgi:hypothetical protein